MLSTHNQASWFLAVVGLSLFGQVDLYAFPDEPQAPTSQAAVDQQRFNDLIAVIEGQNSLPARRTGVRELLLQQWPETQARLLAILNGTNRPARIAIALALSDLSAQINPEYILPILEMLSDSEADARNAAMQALVAASPEVVLPGLKRIIDDIQQSRVARLAAIECLGMMPHRDAVAMLVSVIAQRDPILSDAALTTLEQVTAQTFQGDYQAVAQWWERASQTSSDEWYKLQIEQLVRQNRARRQRVYELEQRLAGALRDNYTRAPEAQRPALLTACLTDNSAAVRLLGLELSQAMLGEGKALPPEAAGHARELLTAAEPAVRDAAVRTVATLREPADAERFLQLLASERHFLVRKALVNGLGYVGSVSAAAPLLSLLESADQATVIETITALGRLAERGVLDEPTRNQVATTLLARMQSTKIEESEMRERLLWALSRVSDSRCGTVFVAALNNQEAATVRLAAARGIAVMIDPRTAKVNGQTNQPATSPDQQKPLTRSQLLDALASMAGDTDASVRRVAVDTLAQYADGDQHTEALWGRLTPEAEPEEAIRVTAWRGALRIIATRPAAVIETWIQRLPGDVNAQRQHAIELLLAAEKQLGANPEARAELGRVRAMLAARQAAQNQIEQAVATYQTALEDLHAGAAPEIPKVALELLRLALIHNRYDSQLATVLAGGNPALDGAALWEGIKTEIEQRLQPDQVDQAIAMLVALQTNPPTSMPADTQSALQQMIERARQVRLDADAALVQAALQKLSENPADEPAKQSIIALGSRAVPTVRAALQAALQAQAPNTDAIQKLHDLLKALAPDWPGFAHEAPLEEKIKALEAL